MYVCVRGKRAKWIFGARPSKFWVIVAYFIFFAGIFLFDFSIFSVLISGVGKRRQELVLQATETLGEDDFMPTPTTCGSRKAPTGMWLAE